MSRFIQVGVTAMRDPVTGEFLESVPLYAEAEDLQRTGADRTMMVGDIRQNLAAAFGQYLKERKKEGAMPG